MAVPGTAIGIAGITYAAADNCVITVGASGSASAGGGLCGSSQIAFDKNGNSEIRITGGYLISTGEKVGGVGTISIFPGMKDVSESRDYFSVLGVSFSLGVGEGLEGHFYGTYTWKLLGRQNLETCLE